MDGVLRERVVVVLVRARNPANIGAVARAMHDLGYSQLRVVNEFSVPFQAARSAVDASSVLAAATQPKTVAEAVADCTLVLGTTAVGERVLEHRLYGLEEAASRVQSHLGEHPVAKVALLFGSEKTGLSNEELSHCHELLTIPMNVPEGKHLSMNLGQAAAICLYRLGREPAATVQTEPEEPAADAGELERITGLLMDVLQQSGCTRRYPANAREIVVRRIVRRMGMQAGDAQVWSGILRQVLRTLRQAEPTKMTQT